MSCQTLSDEELESSVTLRLYSRVADSSDLAKLAHIHKVAYSRSHFTSLFSEETLARYYKYFIGSDSTILLACELVAYVDSAGSQGNSEKILGFAAFGEKIPEKISRFKRDCICEILLTSIQHPIKSTFKLFSSLVSRFSKKEACDYSEFLIVSVAVEYPQRGVGKFLLRGISELASHEGKKSIGLFVNTSNIRALNTYLSFGYRILCFDSGQYYMELSLDN